MKKIYVYHNGEEQFKAWEKTKIMKNTNVMYVRKIIRVTIVRRAIPRYVVIVV
jgi:hypothetical protein